MSISIRNTENPQDHERNDSYTDLILDHNELELLEQLFQQHKYEELVKRVTHHIQQTPSAFFLYNILGLSCAGLGDFQAAIENYKRVLEFQPTNANAHYNMGNAYLNLNQCDDAVQSYKQALHIEPDLIEVYKNMGIALNNLDRYKEAISSYETALAKKADDDELITNLGVAYDNAGETDTAIQYYNLALRKNPNNALPLYRLGCAYNNLGQHAEALQYFEDAHKLMPNDLDLNMQLGILHNNLENWDKAINYFQYVIKIAPENPKGYSSLGSVLQNIEQYKSALQQYDQAIELSYEQADYHYRKGTCLYQCEQLDNALQSLQNALTLSPDHKGALHYMGRCLIEKGQYLEALPLLQHVLKLDENDIASLFCTGCIFLETHDYANAIISFEKICQLDNSFADAYNQLGITYKRLGNSAKAISYFQNAIDLDPENDRYLGNFASCISTIRKIELTQRLQKHVLLCLENPAVSSIEVNPIVNTILHRNLSHLDANAITDNFLEHLDKDTTALLLSYLCNSVITDLKIEHMITPLRSYLLGRYSLDNSIFENNGVALNFVESLAYQAFHNEHIWHISDQETGQIQHLKDNIIQAIHHGEAPKLPALFLLGAYERLDIIPAIREWALEAFENSESSLKKLLEKLIIEGEREIILSQSIETLTTIEDATSLTVQEQYEENPYPRWSNLSLSNAIDYTHHIDQEIYPNKITHTNPSDAPTVLIAGCGTGRQPISSAHRYKNSEILAIDLSMRSLGYAKRKALELNTHNIRFAKADILNLDGLEQTFDIIECAGVLHHMAKPDAGLKALTERLKPNGYLKLGLYSTASRATFFDIRAYAQQLRAENPDLSIQQLRHKLIHSKGMTAGSLPQLADIYTTSAARDLLFHVQEQDYTIPQLKDMLDRNALEFIGFAPQDPQVKLSFLQMFPDDSLCMSLDNWHEFEQLNPLTFIGMYQFWCRPVG